MSGSKPGRPFNRSTVLGQLMWAQGWSVADMETVTNISHRTISDYLAGRQKILNRHLTSLAAALDVEPETLQEVSPQQKAESE